ncbi:hypothetical protein [Absidia glauca]|uniref:HORMA domain-containing protein n=1 Tax=Absidia glauca TaxID=4829 RepID=A0A168T929_ABSGL|nr:hypothetical protein [Absidia glauca]
MPNQESTILLCDFSDSGLDPSNTLSTQSIPKRLPPDLESFEQRKHYNVPVAMSIHPGVCQYIKDFVTSLQPLIEQGQCHLISLVVHSTPLERHVFQLDRSTTHQDDTSYPSFRACLLKLNTLPSLLPTPNDATYTLGMELKGDSNAMDDKNWMPGDSVQSSTTTTWARLIPIKTIDVCQYKINTYILEGKQKGKHVAKDAIE